MAWEGFTDILKKVQSKYPALGKRLLQAQALAQWEKAVGPLIAKHSKAIRVQEGLLLVEVDHPIWKTELHHRKRQILEILNRQSASRSSETSFETIHDIWFVDSRG